jgi:hypothetical protein
VASGHNGDIKRAAHPLGCMAARLKGIRGRRWEPPFRWNGKAVTSSPPPYGIDGK